MSTAWTKRELPSLVEAMDRKAKIYFLTTFAFVVVGVSLIACQVAQAQAPIILSVIGDSYTAGYGDSCPPTPPAPIVCSTLPAPNPNNSFTTSYASAPVMPGACGGKYGWLPKLVYVLGHPPAGSGQPVRTATAVGQCTRLGATSADMLAANCGPITAATNPTHTIIFAGLNDTPAGIISAQTLYNVGAIGLPIGGKRIHVQGNGEVSPPNWTQDITSNQFLNGVGTPPCNGHPNDAGYWIMANNLFTLIKW